PKCACGFPPLFRVVIDTSKRRFPLGGEKINGELAFDFLEGNSLFIITLSRINRQRGCIGKWGRRRLCIQLPPTIARPRTEENHAVKMI
ncbi:hypothetical protein, partial [uncultured Cloacibacillus sp.]|uniref:hypothetical protein n=1 Tax=uncultured Cloacibacillus sp. TaxID=889794 RepID=UPI0027D99270